MLPIGREEEIVRDIVGDKGEDDRAEPRLLQADKYRPQGVIWNAIQWTVAVLRARI